MREVAKQQSQAEHEAPEEEEEAHDPEIARRTSRAQLRREAGHESQHSNTLHVDSHRFSDEPALAKVFAGLDTLSVGASGEGVTKLQAALVDLGYLSAKQIDGDFGDTTKAALEKLQKKEGLTASGALDNATLVTMAVKFDSRIPYVKAAKYDHDHPGTQKLDATEKREAFDALAPQQLGPGGKPKVFVDEVNHEMYGDRIKARLKSRIVGYHKDLFDDRVGQRKDEKNLFDWKTLEGPAGAAKRVTDHVYGSYAKGPALSHKNKTLLDAWEVETQNVKGNSEADNLAWAKSKVMYLIQNDCADINLEHNANPMGPVENQIITPVIDGLTSDAAKVQYILDTEIAWDGLQGNGHVEIQRFKGASADENRLAMWQLFHTCIHEYLHSLAHATYMDWANQQDDTRSNVLIEGFCDFFTLNVRAALAIDHHMQKTIEGPYYDKHKQPPVIDPGVYDQHADAEHVVAVVGVHNAASAYFKGKVELIGG
jgi:hypothetical protein